MCEMGWLQGPLKQMADGPSSTNAIKKAIGVQTLDHFGLEPHLDRARLGISIGLKTAAGIAALGSRTCQDLREVFTPLGRAKPARSRQLS